MVAQEAERLSPGIVIPKVVCAGDPQQSYALYLPSKFSPDKRWPILYAFDPAARGQVAVETIRAAAEKYGYIVVGSNNSRNGADAVSTEAAKAMWDDTHARFPVDERRRYIAGMSGGARMAVALAMSCKDCVAGVIANAAGFPQRRRPSRETKFAYFAALGNRDFNFPEFVELRRELEDVGTPYRIRMFEGQHGWAPPEVWLEALDWMDLQAMRSGSLERDPTRIRQSYDAAVEKAGRMLSDKEFLEGFREYQSAARDFSGLTDVGESEKKVAELREDKRVKAALKEEASAASDQNRLASEPSAQIQALATGNLGADEYLTLRDTLATLRREIAHGGGSSRTLIQERALGGLVVQAIEAGLPKLEAKEYDLALRLFDLAVAGSERPGWAHYCRARAYAGKADKKHMIAELKLAATTGFRDAGVLTAAEFHGFDGDPDFQAISREWFAGSKP